MSLPLRLLLTVPRTARRGELIEIKALAQHAMENGFRHDQNGQIVPTDKKQKGHWQVVGGEAREGDIVLAEPTPQGAGRHFGPLVGHRFVNCSLWKCENVMREGQK